MDLEDQHRFQIEPAQDGLLIWCVRCEDWERWTKDPLRLDELEQLADPHAEACR